jgi:hypothetical protein
MDLAALVVLQTAALAGLLLCAVAAGRLLFTRIPPAAGPERLAWSAAAGLGALGTALFFLGIAGALGNWAVLALGAVLIAAAAAAQDFRGVEVEPESRRRETRFALTALATALLPAFVWTLYPPIAYDATVYHLPFARAFVTAGRLVETPDLVFEIFPQLAETLFAALLAVTGSDRTPALVQLTAVAATALLLFDAGRRLHSFRTGLWAAALYLAHPLVHYQAASPYVDAILALFCLLASLAWERWREAEAARWLILAGAAAGAAAATKYTGLLWFASLAVATLFSGRGIPPLRRLRRALLFVVAALAVATPWYLRIQLATGNPFHPYFQAGITAVDEARPLDTPSQLREIAQSGLVSAIASELADAGDRPLELARFAWRASFSPEAFHRQAPLAPWNLALIPLAALFAWRDVRLRRWLLIVLAYAFFWTTAQPRFQLPGAALLALAGAVALERLAARAPALGRLFDRRAVAVGLAVLLAAPGSLYAAWKVARLGPPPATPAAREAFLHREVPGYAGIAWLERERGSRYTVFLFGAPNLTDFASGNVRGQSRGRWSLTRIRKTLGDATKLHRALLAMEVDHLLVLSKYRHRLPGGEAFRARFRRVEGDALHDLYELVPPPSPAADGG